MKKCSRCQQCLPHDQFSSNRRNPDGLHCSCRKCKAEENREYNERHKEKIAAKKHTYYMSNRDATIARVCQYAKDNREEHNVRCKKAKNKNKREVFSHYCGGEPRCKCGETDLTVLTIDHINGNGAEHRREITGKNVGGGGSRFYFWLKRNNCPDGFQVLCFNCQFRKRAVEMRAEHQTHIKEVRAMYVRSVKLECLDHYGGRVCPCGETDIEVLTLDHVNDDGAEDRRNSGLRGFGWYIHLRKNSFPNDPPLQVLCLNCQFKKRQRKYDEGKDRSTDDNNGTAVVV